MPYISSLLMSSFIWMQVVVSLFFVSGLCSSWILSVFMLQWCSERSSFRTRSTCASQCRGLVRNTVGTSRDRLPPDPRYSRTPKSDILTFHFYTDCWAEIESIPVLWGWKYCFLTGSGSGSELWLQLWLRIRPRSGLVYKIPWKLPFLTKK